MVIYCIIDVLFLEIEYVYVFFIMYIFWVFKVIKVIS